MKLQIALEYMVVLSFVLLVFLLVFVTIASQRALVSNQQTFSRLQLVAEDVASQIDSAATGGNGYTAVVQLPLGSGLSYYNLSVTQGGEVVASTNIVTQVVTAAAFADVPKGVYSNNAFLPSAGSRVYVLPIANGTLFLDNYYGTVCIDYACPNATGSSAAIRLSSTAYRAAYFAGNSVYISLPATPRPRYATISAWIYPLVLYNPPVSYSIFGSNDFTLYLNGFSAHSFCFAAKAAGTEACSSSSVQIPTNEWTFIAASYSSSGISLYVNGTSLPTTGGPSIPTCQGASIGYCASVSGGDAFDGYITNLQFYNLTLTASQISQLYNEGPAGNVVNGNVVGLWPLQGTAQDFSGNGNNGADVGYVPYITAAQLTANVTNGAGVPLNGVLVGFLTSLGMLSSGGQSAAAYTNQNGIATTFLTQGTQGGTAKVKAIAFDSGSWAQANIVGWWPMAAGSGNVVYDITGNGLDGETFNSVWSMPNFVAGMDGSGSMNAKEIPQYAIQGSMTESAWVNLASLSTAQNTPIIATDSPSNAFPMLFVNSGCGCFAFAINTGAEEAVAPAQASTGAWHMVTGVFNSVTETVALYVNGTEVSVLQLPGGVVQNMYGNGFSVGYLPSQGTYLTGQAADVQIYSNALTSNQVEALYSEGLAGEPLPLPDTVAWWQLDGDASDGSPEANNGSLMGGVSFTDPSGILKASNASSILVGSFNGANSVIDMPQGKPLYPATQMTAAAWFSTTSNGVVLWNGNSAQPASASEYSPIIYVNNTGYLSGGDGNGASPPFITPDFVANGKWNFAAVVQNSTGEQMYLNGQLVATSAGAPQSVFPYNWSIGEGWAEGWVGASGSGYSPAFYFKGNIAGVQLYNSSLDSGQIQQLYREGVSGLPLENAGLDAWYPLDGNANDYSSQALDGSAYNVVFIANESGSAPLYTSAGADGINFDGQQAYVQIPNNALLQLSTLTLAGWVYYAGPAPNNAIFNWLAAKQNAWGVGACGNSLVVCYYNWGSGTEYDSNTMLTPDSWHYLTAVISNGNETVYVNGRQVLSGPLTISGQGVGLQIGYGNSGSQYLNGSAADVQVYRSAFTPAQVYQLYKSQPQPVAEATVSMAWLP